MTNKKIATMTLAAGAVGLAETKSGAAVDPAAVVAEGAIAVKLKKVVAHPLDVVERVGAHRMAGQLDPLPAGQFGVDLLPQLLRFGLETFDLLPQLQVLAVREIAHLLDAPFQLDDRLFEVQHETHLAVSRAR